MNSFALTVSDIKLLDSALIFVDTRQREIFQMDLNDYSLSAVPLSTLRSPVAIDIDPNDGLIFWTDITDKTIRRSSVTGNNDVIIKQLSSGAVQFTAVWFVVYSTISYLTNIDNNLFETITC